MADVWITKKPLQPVHLEGNWNGISIYTDAVVLKGGSTILIINDKGISIQGGDVDFITKEKLPLS